MSPFTLAWLVLAGGFGGFVDSVVGGGGVITLPALLAAGVSPHLALGTNKLAGTSASTTATLVFHAAGRVDRRLLLRTAPGVVLAAAAGALLSTRIDASALRGLIIAAVILAAVYAVLRDHRRIEAVEHAPAPRANAAVVTAIGLYDGILGPGAGLFYFTSLVGLGGLGFVDAAGNGRALNLASNAGALITFAALGRVSVLPGLAMAVGVVVGARSGARLTLRRGAAFVRPMLIVVTALLVGRLVLQSLGH